MKQELKTNETAPGKTQKEQGRQELTQEDLNGVSGGTAFIPIPRVKDYDYDDDISGRI